MRRPLPALCFAFLALTLLVPAAAALAQEYPDLSGRVVDRASILSAETEAQLTEILAAHEAQSSDQLVVATISDTGGESIEAYANGLFRHWGLGQAEENNGVLLLIALDDRKMRIEVGYGLEGTLTDVLAKLIIDNTIVPQFRTGSYEEGIRRGVDDIIAVLTGDEAELRARAERNVDSSGGGPDIIGWIFISVFVSIFGGMFGFALLAPIFGKKLSPGRYKWLGMEVTYNGGSSGGRSSGWSGGSSSGGFSGGGGSSGGGGASGGW
ncbi:MAG: YgcG family protein [Alphaproteobacteria bacterium]|nr:YgcG family protein [Alphaproteobacteria bacterium]